jgi:hypothetical protein
MFCIVMVLIKSSENFRFQLYAIASEALLPTLPQDLAAKWLGLPTVRVHRAQSDNKP